ncbi:hypothetical protein TEU_03430 [Thermococcus eurythermalis]|uniref:Uncharacterized protein n=1 Tax=Thermococcus eurythermalis TaxID=1505907 RepID=A0A097QSL1_9EURY|nr:hypothetical protein [Thermococcus eurythermalis]AIU69473.1 hypothetical protein TEU_03430 [Thermococcus eurythermalis]
MKYKKVSSSSFITNVKDKDNSVIKNVLIKKLHYDKKHNTMKVFFNATDCSELRLEEGEWLIEDYRNKASYTENLERWRSGLQLTFNTTASQLLNLFNRRFLGLKIDVENRKISILKFPQQAEEKLEEVMQSL